MAPVQDLPFELLVLIVKDICLTSKTLHEWKSSPFNLDCQLRRSNKQAGRSTWATKHTCSPAKFPFNVANTCRLWQDVIFDSVNPENWIELQFDLASDPRHLLGSIAASKTLLFSVHVFTTADDLSEARKLLENERARAVVQALLLHAGRCTSVVFDLTYASSLPSPVPFLERAHPLLTDLILDYKIYDLPMCYKGTQIKSKPVPLRLSKLSKMSMCGSAFMDITHLGTEWLQAQSGINQAHSGDESTFLTIHLRDFEFPACNNEMIDKEYTFASFIHLLHFINPWTSLHVENISLAYRPHSNVGAAGQYNLQDVDLSSLILENVSRDFIAELFQIGNLNRLQHLHFISCSIPPISSSISCFDINVSDIPTSGASLSYNNDSLYNLISSWEGGSLALTSCPIFDNEFIHWLAEDRGDGECEAYGITFLDIKDCQNFTASAIRRLVGTINDPLKLMDDSWDEGEHMDRLTIYGKGPPLEDEDVLWFEKFLGPMSVVWHVENDDGYVVNRAFG